MLKGVKCCNFFFLQIYAEIQQQHWWNLAYLYLFIVWKIYVRTKIFPVYTWQRTNNSLNISINYDERISLRASDIFTASSSFDVVGNNLWMLIVNEKINNAKIRRQTDKRSRSHRTFNTHWWTNKNRIHINFYFFVDPSYLKLRWQVTFHCTFNYLTLITYS